MILEVQHEQAHIGSLELEAALRNGCDGLKNETRGLSSKSVFLDSESSHVDK